MEVANIASKLTVRCMAIFPTYHVIAFPESGFKSLLFLLLNLCSFFCLAISGICIAKSSSPLFGREGHHVSSTLCGHEF